MEECKGARGDAAMTFDKAAGGAPSPADLYGGAAGVENQRPAESGQPMVAHTVGEADGACREAAWESGAEGEMKRTILAALAGEMRFFLLPDGKIPEWVELRVCYENTFSTLRVGKGEILKAGERRNETN